MENKINIAELLKDCPKGMELDCVSYDNVSFDKISDDKKSIYPIFCYITDKEGNRSGISFTKNGCESKRYGAKCVIFPKGKTTWEGFQRPFKDGDIVVTTLNNIAIIKEPIGTGYSTYTVLFNNLLHTTTPEVGVARLATEEEKQKLFKAIKDNGYKWNEETKTLEKLNNPKFDIATLKPFDRVLTRANDDDSWVCNLYSHRIKDYYVVLNAELALQCIPYEQNKHLIGTTDDCDEFYKTWE